MNFCKWGYRQWVTTNTLVVLGFITLVSLHPAMLRRTQTVEFASQTENGENLELKGHVSTFRHEDEVEILKRDLEKYELRNVRMRDNLNACLREKDWAIRQSHNHISLLKANSSYFGSLPDDYD